MKNSKWTLVRHSAFLIAHDEGFAQGLEVQSISPGEVTKVLKAGGLVFDTYSEADNAEYTLSYPDDSGIFPHANGTFGMTVDDGRPIYLPTTDDHKLLDQQRTST